jgi:Tol biopolymer transport system component
LFITTLDDTGRGIVYPPDMVVVNPFTHEQKRFPSDYPDIDQADAASRWDNRGITLYDPTLTRVVYASFIKHDYRGESEQGYVLWDLVQHRNVIEIANGNFKWSPHWSPDGSRFVIMGMDMDFLAVTRDGQVTRLTYFNPDPNQKRTISSEIYDWSPDGRSLAFWLETMQDQHLSTTLAILDLITGEVTDTCISAGNTLYPLPSVFNPGWSPDRKALVVIVGQQDEGKFDELLVDLDGQLAYKIGNDLFPVGWLAGNK